MATLDKYKIFRTVGIGLLLIGATLCIIGFFIPPKGQIDGSVLTAFGELLGGTGILMCWSSIDRAIDKGIDTTIKHKDTEIHIENQDNQPQQ